MIAIEIKDLHKSYGSLKAIEGISLRVHSGELFGLIGPDAAGKTTLLRAICSLILPDEGSILVQGLDVTKERAKIRQRLGYMPQRFSLYPDLTVEQNLQFFADLFGVPTREREPRLRQLYGFSHLEPFKTRRTADLSGGMKQKLALSCALIHTPPVLVLDEPTYGVDPLSRQEFWEILRSIQGEGTTILLSTAYMDEADLCDRVALLSQGRIVGLDTPAHLKGRFPYPLFRLRGQNQQALGEFFSALEGVRAIQMFGDSLHISFTVTPKAQDWQEWRLATRGNLTQWEPSPPSMEDVFLALMEEQK